MEISLRTFVDVVKDPYQVIDAYKRYTQRKMLNPAEYDADSIIDTISDLLGCDEKDIRRYYTESLVLHNDLKNKTENLPRMGAMDMDGVILYMLLRGVKAKKIVETGVANGASTYYILSAIKTCGVNAHLYSIDRPCNEDALQKDILRKIGILSKHKPSFGGIIPAGKEVGWLVPEELRSNHWSSVKDSNWL